MTSVVNLDKWIEGLAPASTVADAARISLEHRLRAVFYFLPLAADHSEEDAEYVHLLRVWARRAVATLVLYKGVLPKKLLLRFRKKLERIRRAAGAARDLDVLLSNIESQESSESKPFADRVRRKRKKAQRPIKRCFHGLRRQRRLAKQLKSMLRSVVNNAESTRSYNNWAHIALRGAVERFQRAFPCGSHDLQTVHRFRIRVKKLRYAIELLAPAFSSEIKEFVYPVVEELQSLLGRINDRAVAISCFREWLAICPPKVDRSELRKKIAQENELLDQSLEDFYRWWTHEVQSQILDSLTRLTST